MNPELKNFRVVPSVLPADKTSTVEISAIDGCFLFYDDVTYDVEVIAMEESDVPIDPALPLLAYRKHRKLLHLRPEGGVLRLTYHFSGEQEWNIRISTKEYAPHQNPLYAHYAPHWNSLIRAPERGISLRVFSLREDLYRLRPMRADLHVHTNRSDGADSPDAVCASYRRAGYDAVAITDHNLYDTARETEEKLRFADRFRILRGEEVHNGYVGYFHTVHLGGTYSVNDRYLNEPDLVEQEVRALEGTVPVPQGLDPYHYLSRVWLYREIKKSGGVAIFAHPYWLVGGNYHTESAMSRAIMQNGLCDAVELPGGVHAEENNLIAALWAQLRAEGVNTPVVGSTDSHSIQEDAGFFLTASTLLFSENGSAEEAILNNRTAAIEHPRGEHPHAYGDYRFVRYALFLWRQFYPLRNELCAASGTLMEQYLHGADYLRPAIELAERRIREYDQDFFGE